MGNKMPAIDNTIETIVNSLKEASKDPYNKNALADALLAYLEAKYRYKDASLYQFGLKPNDDLCKALAGIQKNGIWEDAVYKKAKQYLDEAWKQETNHKDRRKKIEDAIRLLKRLHEERKSLKPETLTLLSKAYLLRSQIVRPKGITIPAKKLEAIREGIRYADCRLKALLYLELDRLGEEGAEIIEGLKGKHGTIQDVLKEALPDNPDNFNPADKDDIRIAVRYSELKDNKYLSKILSSSIPNTELEKARAYRLLKNDSELKKEMKSLIGKLKAIHFSSPLWDDTVRFLIQLYDDDKNGKWKNDTWKELALKTWDACRHIEEKTPSTLHIRWYWSRQRALYDLAFLAADNITDEQERCRKRVEIAESLKSRPSLRWNILEELAKGDEWLKELYEAESAALSGGYVINYDELNKKFTEYKKKIKETLADERKSLDITTGVPNGWIVIHFYLNHLEGKGYALIINNGNWTQEPFEYNELFKSYIEWQTNYNLLKQTLRTNRGKYGSHKSMVSEYLETLCRNIGKCLPFLLRFNKESPVLFVTHDFLHRLPLHGAINNEEMFLKKHPSCYLPAWSLYKGKTAGISDNGNYIVKKFDKDYYDKLMKGIKWKNVINSDNPPDNLESLCSLSAPPGFLVILCHGKADNINPFNTKLMLRNNPTHLEITKLKIKLNGSRVVLGACETDLVPPLSDIIDEHLSILTTFLNKGAYEILGTLWVVDPDIIEDAVISRCSTSNNLMNAIWEFQKDNINDFLLDLLDLFNYLPFRIIGMP